MSPSPARLIKRCAQWIPIEQSSCIPPATRGIYALLSKHGKNKYDVVYVGMTFRSSVGRRLQRHKNNKNGKWTHFSVFEVRDGIGEKELLELEGLLREVYRKDSRANKLNQMRKYGAIQKLRIHKIENWKKEKA